MKVLKALSISRLSLVLGLALGIMVVWTSVAPSAVKMPSLYRAGACDYCVEKWTSCSSWDQDCSGHVDICEWKASGTWRNCRDTTRTGCTGANCGYKTKKEQDCY